MERTIKLPIEVVKALEEGRDATNPTWSLTQYIEHLVAMHQQVRQMRKDAAEKDIQL